VSDELKPCPFCGSVVEIVQADQQSSRWERVWCLGCGPIGPVWLATKRDELIAWWNTRWVEGAP
jgi:Lar family restriction alleviation protein